MSFIRKHSGDSTRPIVAVYTCELHGEIDVEVQRDENGEAPNSIPCPETKTGFENVAAFHVPTCGQPATWTPTPIACRVRRIEAVKGKWEKPARSTYLDTRDMGEGMDEEEFRAKRARIWEEKRKQDVMAVKRGE